MRKIRNMFQFHINLKKTSFWAQFEAALPYKPQTKDFTKIILSNFQLLCCSNFVQKTLKLQ